MSAMRGKLLMEINWCVLACMSVVQGLSAFQGVLSEGFYCI